MKNLQSLILFICIAIYSPLQAQIAISSITTTPTLCSGSCDGTITVNVTNATGNVLYDIGNGPQSSNVFTNVCAGTYTVVVTDDLPSTATGNTTVSSPPPATSTSSILNPVSCFGACDGNALVFTNGGTPPYTISGPFPGSPLSYSSVATLSNLCGGVITFLITDANNCTYPFVMTMPQPPQLQVSATATAESSSGACDGTIAISASGGTSPYQYSIDNGTTWNTNPNFNSVCSGTYTVCVMDANACQQCTSVTLPPPCNMVSTIFNFTPESCFGACDGTAVVASTNGTAPYVITGPFSGSPQTYMGSTNISGLCGGSQTLSITDANGCMNTVIATIPAATQITANATVVNESISGNCDGSITINASGGAGSYTYNINGGSYQASNVFSSLCNGTYQVCVKDANNCVACFSYTVNSDNCNTMTSAPSANNASCNGVCDGLAIIFTTGGTGPYTVTLNSMTYMSSGATTIPNLCAGTYTAVVTDVNGCTNTVVFTINQPSAITSTASIVDESTMGSCDGSITVNASGGSPNYTYSINGGSYQSSNVFSLLCSGSYQVCVKDANNCIQCFTYSVTSGNCSGMVSTSSQNGASCNGVCDGMAIIFTTGGQAPYSVTVNGMNYSSSGATTIPNLCAGTYNAVITDANGCVNNWTFVIVEPAAITLSASSTNESINGACDGNISVSASNGVSPYAYSIDGGTNWQGNNTFNNLCSGAYTVCVQDANGCINCTTVAVSIAGCNMVSTYTNTTTTSCSYTCDATTMVASTNGTAPYVISGPFTNSPQTYTSVVTLTGLCPGAQTMVITDAAGCTEILIVYVTAPPAITVTASGTNPSSSTACDGVLTGNASGGTGSLAYSWVDCATYTSFGTAPTWPNVCSGTYALIVYDQNNCSDTSSCFTISGPVAVNELNENVEVSIYPNPTNNNFTISAEGINSDKVSVEIYNNLGEVVYQNSYSTNGNALKQNIAVNLEQGLYYVRLSNDAFRKTMPLSILK